MSKHRGEPQSCIVCGGSGKVPNDTDGSEGRRVEWVRCDACNGKGTQP